MISLFVMVDLYDKYTCVLSFKWVYFMVIMTSVPCPYVNFFRYFVVNLKNIEIQHRNKNLDQIQLQELDPKQ